MLGANLSRRSVALLSLANQHRKSRVQQMNWSQVVVQSVDVGQQCVPHAVQQLSHSLGLPLDVCQRSWSCLFNPAVGCFVPAAPVVPLGLVWWCSVSPRASAVSCMSASLRALQCLVNPTYPLTKVREPTCKPTATECCNQLPQLCAMHQCTMLHLNHLLAIAGKAAGVRNTLHISLCHHKKQLDNGMLIAL